MYDHRLDMFNPLRRLELLMLQKLRSSGNRFLVSQTYARGAAGTGKTGLLFSPYEDHVEAKIHLHAIAKDKLGAIADLEHDAHRTKVIEVLSPDSGYIAYVNMVIGQQQLNKQLNELYDRHLGEYLKKHTTWNLTRNSGLRKKLVITYGEPYLQLNYGTQSLKIAVEELENA